MAIETAKTNAVKRGITATFRQAAASASPIYPKMAQTNPSAGANEEYVISGSQPGMREFVGDRVFNQLTSARFTIANKHFESSVEIDRTDFDDDRIGMYSNAIGELGEEAACHPDELLFDLIKNGASTACYDGQYFFDSDHLWRDSGALSNKITHTVGSLSAVTPMEAKASVRAGISRMKTFKKDNGKFWYRPNVVRMSDFVIVCPLALEDSLDDAFEQKQSLEIVSSSFGATTNHFREKPTILACPYLNATETNGSDAKFYLFYVGGRYKPFVWQPRQKIRTEVLGLNSIKNKYIEFMTEARYNFGYFMWQYAIEITLST